MSNSEPLTKREEVGVAFMPRNNTRDKDALIAWIDGLPALIKLGAPVIGTFIWFQNNFVTMKMYADQQNQIISLNQRIDNQYKEIKEFVDKRFNESIVHSNDNRDRMMAVMAEIKDSLKTLYLDRSIQKK
jgi:hypothetical protein